MEPFYVGVVAGVGLSAAVLGIELLYQRREAHVWREMAVRSAALLQEEQLVREQQSREIHEQRRVIRLLSSSREPLPL